MKYELIELKWITERGNIALIKRGEKHKEYAVVMNLDVEKPFESNDQWDWTVEYYSADIKGLQQAVDCFRRKSEYEYISRARLEELATNFKDFIMDYIEDEEDTTEELIAAYDIEDYEASFFGLKESEE